MASMNIISLRRSSMAPPPGRRFDDSAAAWRMHCTAQSWPPAEGRCSRRGSAAISGLNGRRSQPRKPHTSIVSPRGVAGAASHGLASIEVQRKWQVLLLAFEIALRVRRRAHAGGAGDHMRVAVRKDDEVARRQMHRLAAHRRRPAGTGEHHMKLHDVLGAGHYRCGDFARRRRFGRPVARAVHGEVQRAAQAHIAQHVGKDVLVHRGVSAHSAGRRQAGHRARTLRGLAIKRRRREVGQDAASFRHDASNRSFTLEATLMNQNAATQKTIVRHHLQAFVEQAGLDAILSDYADDACFLSEDRAYCGKQAIRAFFEAIHRRRFPSQAIDQFTLRSLRVQGNVAHITWSAGPEMPPGHRHIRRVPGQDRLANVRGVRTTLRRQPEHL